jgi:hypothetical protein
MQCVAVNKIYQYILPLPTVQPPLMRVGPKGMQGGEMARLTEEQTDRETERQRDS